MPDKFKVRNSAGISVANGTSNRTVLQVVAPSTARPYVLRWKISSDDGAATDDAVRVRLMIQSSAGTGGDAVTPAPFPGGPTAATVGLTAQENVDGGDPTAGDILEDFFLPVAGGGIYEDVAVDGREIQLAVSGRIAIVVDTGAQTRVFRASMEVEV